MDRKEAINALKLINLKSVHPFLSWEEMLEVRNMAIAALQEPEIVHCKDCKHWYKEIMYCTYTGMQIEPHGYCVYGEVEE